MPPARPAIAPTRGITACEVPVQSLLGRAMVDAATYHDSYRATLTRQDEGITDIFLAIFAHHPRWMKLLLILRNRVASLAGLDAPRASEVISTPRADRYAVGQTIGVWPIFALTEDEIIAGRDNRHLDFRVSVLRVDVGGERSVVVSTVCMVHNRAGRLYLACILPFHRRGVRLLMARARAAGRL